jgi:glycine hydroxymethyltransferase
MKEAEMQQIAGWIVAALKCNADAAELARIQGEVKALCARFPLY